MLKPNKSFIQNINYLAQNLNSLEKSRELLTPAAIRAMESALALPFGEIVEDLKKGVSSAGKRKLDIETSDNGTGDLESVLYDKITVESVDGLRKLTHSFAPTSRADELLTGLKEAIRKFNESAPENAAVVDEEIELLLQRSNLNIPLWLIRVTDLGAEHTRLSRVILHVSEGSSEFAKKPELEFTWSKSTSSILLLGASQDFIAAGVNRAEDAQNAAEVAELNAKSSEESAELSATNAENSAVASELSNTESASSAEEARVSAATAKSDVAEAFTTGVEDATEQAVRAEAARDAAFVNADVYATEVEGRAAVAVGEQFQVLSDDGSEYIRYRKDSTSAATEVARYASPSSIPKVGFTGITQIVPPNVHEVIPWGIDAGERYVSGGYRSMVLDVVPGDTLSMWNDQETYTNGSGCGHAFFSGKPLVTDNIIKGHTRTTVNNGNHSYISVTVPEGARYLVANTYFYGSGGSADLTIDWNIVRNAPYLGETKADYQPVAVYVDDAPVLDTDLRTSIRTILGGNLYSIENLQWGRYLLNNNNETGTSHPWATVHIPVSPGLTYSVYTGGAPTNFPFRIALYEDSLNLGAVSLTPGGREHEYVFTVPASSTATQIKMNVVIANNPAHPTYVLDMKDSLIFALGEETTGNELPVQYLSEFAGQNVLTPTDVARILRDDHASTPPPPPPTRLSSGDFYCFGDSITWGTHGGFLQYLAEAFQTETINYGSSAGRATRLVGLMTDQPRRDSTTGTQFATPDYTGVPAISIMIGTNDSDGGYNFGSISDIPEGSVHDYEDHNEYFQLFPSNYLANIALCIEYVQWKNPETEIHLITPPYRYGPAGTERITKLIPPLEAVARHYGVHLIYATYESGISYKGMHPTQGAYTYDGIHFNEVGNRVFGKFIAQKILSFG